MCEVMENPTLESYRKDWDALDPRRARCEGKRGILGWCHRLNVEKGAARGRVEPRKCARQRRWTNKKKKLGEEKDRLSKSTKVRVESTVKEVLRKNKKCEGQIQTSRSINKRVVKRQERRRQWQ